MKHIGIVACSAEGAALCYQSICRDALQLVGKNDHPRITLHSIPLAAWMPSFEARDFQGVARVSTRLTMAGPVYRNALSPMGIDTLVPEGADFDTVDRVIFEELVDGVLKDESRRAYNRIIARLKERGCDAVALACTEIPLLVRPEESPLPTLDSTHLLATAALREAID